MVEFNKIQDNEKSLDERIVEKIVDGSLKPLAELFGFGYNYDLTPKNPEPILTQRQEGVCRTQTTEKYSHPKPSVYRGWENGKFVFEFSEPLFENAIKARHYKKSLYDVQINIYPRYIYSLLKVIPDKQMDEVFRAAVNELDAVITRKDMDFTHENNYQGNSYKYDCPFYLSFLKTQVIIMLADRSYVINASQKAENKPVEDFGVYCPYHEMMPGCYHPAIMLDLGAIRTYAEKELKDLKSLYMHILLELLAYAYQDPTNKVDKDGAFEKLYKPKKEDFSFSYNEEEAAAFVKKYLP